MPCDVTGVAYQVPFRSSFTDNAAASQLEQGGARPVEWERTRISPSVFSPRFESIVQNLASPRACWELFHNTHKVNRYILCCCQWSATASSDADERLHFLFRKDNTLDVSCTDPG
jgi:hypothetical protein